MFKAWQVNIIGDLNLGQGLYSLFQETHVEQQYDPHCATWVVMVRSHNLLSAAVGIVLRRQKHFYIVNLKEWND